MIPTDNSVVRLSIAELRLAGLVGYERWLYAVEHRLRAEHGEDGANTMNHILGAWGEYVVARDTLNPWPTFFTPDQHAPDVGCWHVRTGSRPTDQLIAHDEDPDDGKFVLVVMQRAGLFRIVGWCYGKEAKTAENWQDWTGRPAFFCPQDQLRPWDQRL